VVHQILSFGMALGLVRDHMIQLGDLFVPLPAQRQQFVAASLCPALVPATRANRMVGSSDESTHPVCARRGRATARTPANANVTTVFFQFTFPSTLPVAAV
jgi:hypothetical protein